MGSGRRPPTDRESRHTASRKQSELSTGPTPTRTNKVQTPEQTLNCRKEGQKKLYDKLDDKLGTDHLDMNSNSGLNAEQNPYDKQTSYGPNTETPTFPMLNKHRKMYQPSIVQFLQTQSKLDKQSEIDSAFQIELKNKFSALIDDFEISEPILDNVVNLSNRTLNSTENNLLNKGLNFCPTPGEPNMGEIRRDLDKFHRSLRIDCWLHKKGQQPHTLNQIGPFDNVRDIKIKSQSTWEPPSGPPNLEYIISTNEMGILSEKIHKTCTPNVTKLDRKCLSDLANDQSIVIKKADKGGAIVIQNRTDYIAEGERQLSDGKFYRALDQDPTLEHNVKIKNQLDMMQKRGEITKKLRDFLYLENPRTPELYLLPKIHKNTQPPPGRPIISANNSPTERISAFVDTFLRPIVAEGKSYIKDTSDFINKLSSIGTIQESSLLVSLDVTSLYTNIPNKEGINATHQALLANRGLVNNPSNLSLAELLSLVLTLNNFKFNETNYLQIGGTAMGTRLAPSFANIYMNHFEETHVYTYPFKPTAWFRYIDDIFMIWDYGSSDLDTFIDYLNSCNDNIKFSSEISETELNFLDVTVKVKNQRLTTDLYTKPTDRNTYLPYNSAHPKHCVKGLPYGQFLRIRRICSENEDYIQHATKKAAQLIQRGYPKERLVESSIKAYNQDRDSLLKPKTNKDTTEKKEEIFLTTTYNRTFPGLRNQVESTWELLGRSSTTRHIGEKTLRVGYRRPKNLRDYLVKAKLPTTEEGKKQTEPSSPRAKCDNTKCRYCSRLNKTGRVTSHTTGRSYTCMKNVDCTSNNLVYCINCKKCGKQYIGQTKNTLKTRFQSHFYLIKHQKNEHEVPRHFNMKGHKHIHPVVHTQQRRKRRNKGNQTQNRV